MEFFRVPEANFGQLEEGIDRLARRADKLGLKAPALVVDATEDVPMCYCLTVTGGQNLVDARNATEQARRQWHFGPVVEYRRFYVLHVDGEAPTVPGWALVAVVEHGDTEVGNVIRAVPGMTCPVEYRTAGPYCHHCRTSRRRLETFILRRTADGAGAVDNGNAVNAAAPIGTVQQVGRNCLADFYRDAGRAEQLAMLASLLSDALGLACGAEGDPDDDEQEGRGGRCERRHGALALLETTALVIRNCGWVSRGLASDTGKSATADKVGNILADPKRALKAESWDSLDNCRLKETLRAGPTDADKALAAATLAWVRGMRGTAEGLSDYLYNLLVVLSEESVRARHLGIACSAVSTYAREMGLLEERKKAAVSRHFGQEKDKVRLAVTLLGVNHFENTWGTTHFARFRCADGNIAVWYASSESELEGLETGSECTLVGTVKKHSEYKGTLQTVLTRCRTFPVAKCACGGLLIPADKKCPACRCRLPKAAPSVPTVETTNSPVV